MVHNLAFIHYYHFRRNVFIVLVTMYSVLHSLSVLPERSSTKCPVAPNQYLRYAFIDEGYSAFVIKGQVVKQKIVDRVFFRKNLNVYGVYTTMTLLFHVKLQVFFFFCEITTFILLALHKRFDFTTKNNIKYDSSTTKYNPDFLEMFQRCSLDLHLKSRR